MLNRLLFAILALALWSGAASAQVVVSVANATATGTTNGSLAKLTGAPSTAVITATTDTDGIQGVVVSGGGTSGNALIAREGIASCTFDGATTAGDAVVNSTTTAGDCHDTGSATRPTGNQLLGYVLASGSGGLTSMIVTAGTYTNSSGGGGSGSFALGGGQQSGLNLGSNGTYYCSVATPVCSGVENNFAGGILNWTDADGNRTYGHNATTTGSGFYARAYGGASGATVTFTLRINGASPSSGPACTITENASGYGSCSDTTHGATATAGQQVDVQVTGSSGSGASAVWTWSLSAQ
jgi:hypothetical protein